MAPGTRVFPAEAAVFGERGIKLQHVDKAICKPQDERYYHKTAPVYIAIICNYCTYSQTRIIKVVEWHAVILYHKQWKHTTAPSQWPAPATTCLCYKVRLLVPRTTHIHTLSRFTISDGLVCSSHSTYCNKKSFITNNEQHSGCLSAYIHKPIHNNYKEL